MVSRMISMTCKHEHCVSWQGQRQSILTRLMYLTAAVAAQTSRTISLHILSYSLPTHQCLLLRCFYYNPIFRYFIRTKEYSVINDPVLLNHCNSQKHNHLSLLRQNRESTFLCRLAHSSGNLMNDFRKMFANCIRTLSYISLYLWVQ